MARLWGSAPPADPGAISTLQWLTRAIPSTEPFRARLRGAAQAWYVIEATPDLLQWLPILTNRTENFILDFADPGSLSNPHRFYRARPYP